MSEVERFDLIVIGAGPAGQKAAIQGAKAKKRVLLVEEGVGVGGECVRRGTIPSKTLRETAQALRSFRARTGCDHHELLAEGDQKLETLMGRMDAVVSAHVEYIGRQLARNDVTYWRGRAKFLDAHTLAVHAQDGSVRRITSDAIVIATGSRPRTTKDIPVDHEHILDSDSILSMSYLPRSLAILGAGVIASEYASIFAALGTRVTMIDRGIRPVSFMDPELTEVFVASMREAGGEMLGGERVESVAWNGIDAVVTRLSSGREIVTEKVLCAFGRVANLGHLDVAAAGLSTNERGLLDVDAHGRTKTPGIYAAGDVTGPPALASAAMEQGRNAARHAIGLAPSGRAELTPMAVYTIPEMASVGLTEPDAIAKHGGAIVGRARFDEIARGQIAAATNGLLKLVCDPEGKKLLGVHVVGECAAELVHVGQMALVGAFDVDVFVDNVFNFPTFAEAYRVAALDVLAKRDA